MLEQPASYVAGKPVVVYCAKTRAAWRELTISVGAQPAADGFVDAVGGATVNLRDDVCLTLLRRMNRKVVTLPQLANPLLTLVHESAHLRGLSNEGETDCDALSRIPDVGGRFFCVQNTRLLSAWALNAHRHKPPEYQGSC